MNESGPFDQDKKVRDLLAFRRRLLLESRVQAFATCTYYVPVDARRFYLPAELPPALENIAMQIDDGQQAWLAWTDKRRIWFVVAEMVNRPNPSRPEEEALKMTFYDEQGQVLSAGTWDIQPDGSWKLCSS